MEPVLAKPPTPRTTMTQYFVRFLKFKFLRRKKGMMAQDQSVMMFTALKGQLSAGMRVYDWQWPMD